jgi:hypothetical protein
VIVGCKTSSCPSSSSIQQDGGTVYGSGVRPIDLPAFMPWEWLMVEWSSSLTTVEEGGGSETDKKTSHSNTSYVNPWDITTSAPGQRPVLTGFSLSLFFFMGGMFWLFIVGLFYFHIDSLAYAFGWSAFLCRIGFYDTLVVIFLSKHHHHHH